MNDVTPGPDLTEHLRQVAHDFQELGEAMSQTAEPTAFEAVTRLAVERVPTARAASITILEHGRFKTVAATHEIALRADRLQYDLGSGPCVDAILDETVYNPKDLAVDDRWPEYGRRVVDELGLRAMLSYRMTLEQAGVIAGLNLYAQEADAFNDRDLAEGLLLVTHAAQAVAAARLRNQVDNLERALASNRDIGTAIGVLMAQHKITRTQAFDLLRIASQNTNRKLREVAQDVIETGTVDITPPSRGV